ncbi:MAG: metal ABC transporter substrate-binding protein [Oscillospiraceae bacterium]|nr:metal ABC transporter substrate-binding protein [Oscillospiraceae bacterium]
MRKLFLVLLVLSSVLFLSTGCRQKRVGVIGLTASVYPVYLILLNVAGGIENFEVNKLEFASSGCVHEVSLTTKDRKKMEESSALVVNFAGEGSFEKRISLDFPKTKVVDSSKEVDILKDHDGDENSHIWLSVGNHIKQTENIASDLCVLFPEHRQKIAKNAEEYSKKLKETKDIGHRLLDEFSGKDVLVSCSAFDYFFKEFGLNPVPLSEGHHENLSTGETLKAIEIIKKSRTEANCVFFPKEDYNENSLKTVLEETNMKGSLIYLISFGDSSKDDYISKMESNFRTVRESFLKNY